MPLAPTGEGGARRSAAGRSAALAFALVAGGTVLGLAGIDLVLPAVPSLPAALGGDAATAQLVLAAFVAGTGAGLLLFGTLGARLGRRRTLALALGAYAALSLAGALSPDIAMLVAARFLQGVAASAPAVLAPGIIRSAYGDRRATRAIGLLGSLEALAPAVAPILGVWLVAQGGWQAPFLVTAALAALLALAIGLAGGALGAGTVRPAGGSYAALLRSPVFLRYALSQALVLGGLIVFVLGAPSVIVRTMGGELRDFVVMQLAGIGCFIVAANASDPLAGRFGAERLIALGSAFALLGALLLLGYAWAGGRDPALLPLLFAPMNLGLGLRGPPGFLGAIVAGRGDDDRAASLTILAITAVSAGGTALLAPFIERGLPALALGAAGLQLSACLILALLPRLPVRR